MEYYTNNTQLLGNLLNIFSQGNLRFPEGRRPEGNLKLPRENIFNKFSNNCLLFVLSHLLNISVKNSKEFDSILV